MGSEKSNVIKRERREGFWDIRILWVNEKCARNGPRVHCCDWSVFGSTFRSKIVQKILVKHSGQSKRAKLYCVGAEKKAK